MKGSYMSPAKNIHGAVLPCLDEHPDLEIKRKHVPLVAPEYKGVSDAFRALFVAETRLEIIPELLPEVETEVDFAASFLTQTRHFLKR